MNNNKKISVIVPVYNGEKYLEKCINSLVNQTYQNLEIILIDDGSTDRSGKICDSFAKLDERIVVIHQSNLGVSSARNNGIKVSTGFYIAFVDSDDSVDTQMYEKMIEYLEKNNLGIVMCGRNAVRQGRKTPFFYYDHDCIIPIKEARELILTDTWGSQPCDKLFRKSLWTGITFPEGRIYEDLATIYKCFYKTNLDCGYIHDALYDYSLRADSISFKRNYKQIYGLFMAFKERYDFAEKNEPLCVKRCLSKAGNSALGVINTYCSESIKADYEVVRYAKEFLGKYKKELLHSEYIPVQRKMLMSAYFYLPSVYKMMLKLK